MPESIDLSGKSQPLADERPHEFTDKPLGARVGSLRNTLEAGADAGQILDAIIAAPEDNLIPWEECLLPSRGLYYGWPDGTIMVRAWPLAVEKIMTTARLVQTGQAMDRMFEVCCKFPAGFDASQLLLGDRTFLFYFLRGITHGNLYEFMVTCPNQECQGTSTHTYDLNQLVSTVKMADPSLGVEPFQVPLPYLSQVSGREVWVGIRFLRAADGNDIVARRSAKQRMFAKPGSVRQASAQQKPRSDYEAVDESLSENLERIIVNFMGVSDQFKIRQLVSGNKLHARDTAAIREWLREHSPGIDSTVTIECPQCKGGFTVGLPITDSFFRPSDA
jgi:hypothetical protein